MRILVKWPTRGRWKQFVETLVSYRVLQTGRDMVRYMITTDLEDSSEEHAIRLASRHFDLMTHEGMSNGKIDAINRDMVMAGEWDILVLASDDMIPQVEGWDDVIRADMRTYFPDTDGCLWYSDGSIVTDKLCTMVVMGRKYYERFGYIYHPDYKELWCDNEYTEVAKKLGKIKRIDVVLFKHCHPLNGQAPASAIDDVYRKSEAMFHVDHATFDRRVAMNFGLPEDIEDAPVEEKSGQPTLDILMCSLTSRMAGAELMRQSIHDQTRGKDVCVLVEVDDGELSIGAKRNKLVRRSDADYVCFVDDDDTVSDDYVASLLAAIRGRPDVVTFNGTILWMGVWKPWEIRLGHGFTESDGKFLRPPNHLCPIKRKIALQHSFPDKNFGEDAAYAQSMMKDEALKTEVHLDKELYFYEPNPKPRKD